MPVHTPGERTSASGLPSEYESEAARPERFASFGTPDSPTS